MITESKAFQLQLRVFQCCGVFSFYEVSSLYLVDTYVYRDNCDWVNWRWDLLAEKLECFDLLGDIHLGEENNCQVHIDTNNFFTNLVNLYTRRVSYDEKVWVFVIF